MSSATPLRAPNLALPSTACRRLFTVAAAPADADAPVVLRAFIASTPGADSREVWSATLEVDRPTTTSTKFGCDNSAASGTPQSCITSLSDDDYDYGEGPHEVQSIYWDSTSGSQKLIAKLSRWPGSVIKRLFNTMTLNAGDTEFPISEATATRTHLEWAADNLGWADDQLVSLSLTEPRADGYYVAGDTVRVDFLFSETITVTGTPQLTIAIGWRDRVANCARHADDKKRLTCSYAVVTRAAGMTASTTR